MTRNESDVKRKKSMRRGVRGWEDVATADSQEFQGESRRPLKTGRPATGLVFIFASAKTSTPTER